VAESAVPALIPTVIPWRGQKFQGQNETNNILCDFHPKDDCLQAKQLLGHYFAINGRFSGMCFHVILSAFGYTSFFRRSKLPNYMGCCGVASL